MEEAGSHSLTEVSQEVRHAEALHLASRETIGLGVRSSYGDGLWRRGVGRDSPIRWRKRDTPEARRWMQKLETYFDAILLVAVKSGDTAIQLFASLCMLDDENLAEHDKRLHADQRTMRINDDGACGFIDGCACEIFTVNCHGDAEKNSLAAAAFAILVGCQRTCAHDR